MSDEGERTCPLCAEEMDLTDQHLKPCKCGYQICVWCWHQIMDMAEKDDTEGRCPACRAPYDKEKIVGMAAKCERLVAEISTVKKKSQKAKSKSSEGRKQLSSVRVIQRNLVYIVGLPLHLADEDLLQHKEYFGQYGKVLKVSMSRTAAGSVQQFPNNTCSVYITYSKEEEAIRCIQSVHGFILEARPLRACFGTTKYCHAWLRNMPCSNPDCLYLHEIGSQEDSFTKDEIISAYTRVQQITGVSNNQERRAGDVLPPPLDDYNSSFSTAKPVTKNASSSISSMGKSSLPNGTSGRANGLPPAASWAARASNSQPQAASVVCTNGFLKQKPETRRDTVALSPAAACTTQASSLQSDTWKTPILNDQDHHIQSKGDIDTIKSSDQYIGLNPQSTVSEKSLAVNGTPGSADIRRWMLPSDSKSSEPGISALNSLDPLGKYNDSSSEEEILSIDGSTQNLSSDLLSMSISGNIQNDHSAGGSSTSSLKDHVLVKPSEHHVQESNVEQCSETQHLPATRNASVSIDGLDFPGDRHEQRTDSKNQVTNRCSDVEEDIQFFNSQRLKDPEVTRTSLPKSVNLHDASSQWRSHSLQHDETFSTTSLSASNLFVDSKVNSGLSSHPFSGPVSNGLPENWFQNCSGFNSITGSSHLFIHDEKKNLAGMQEADVAKNNLNSNIALDNRESSIITDILSLDSWDDSLTSARDFAKFLEETDKGPGPVSRIPSSRKVHNNNQSRFSFARQEEYVNQPFDAESTFSLFGQSSKNHTSSFGSLEKGVSSMNKLGVLNGISSHNLEELNNFDSRRFDVTSNKHSAYRAQVSAPPGFSVPSRAPPPGFSVHERVEQAYGTKSGNYLLDGSSMLANSYQTMPTGSIGSNCDVELIDPAIIYNGRLHNGPDNLGLNVRSKYAQELNAVENDARLQLLMQRSLPHHQNLRYPDTANSFSLVNDSYGSPRLLDQSQDSNLSYAHLSIHQSRNSLASNAQWDAWNGVANGTSLGMAELLRNERLGFNQFPTNYDNSKFQMSSSGGLYNRSYGM